jgi:serine/threonine protein kinase
MLVDIIVNNKTKPSSTPRITIVDFTLSKPIKYENGQLVLVPITVGHSLLSSPESFRYSKVDGIKYDTWSIGVVFYWAIFKEYPFERQFRETQKAGEYGLFTDMMANLSQAKLPGLLSFSKENVISKMMLSGLIREVKKLLIPDPQHRPTPTEYLGH